MVQEALREPMEAFRLARILLATTGSRSEPMAGQTCGLHGATWGPAKLRILAKSASRPGRLAVCVISGPATAGDHPSLIIDKNGGMVSYLAIKSGVAYVGGLPSGEYELMTASNGIATSSYSFTIRREQETRLDLDLEPGTPTELVVVVNGETSLPRGVDLEVRTSDGKRVFKLAATHLNRDCSVWPSIALRLGTYRAQITAGGRKGEAEFSVSTKYESVRVEVLLR